MATFNEDNTVDITSLADSMGVTEKTIRNRLKEHGGFWIDEGKSWQKIGVRERKISENFPENFPDLLEGKSR